MKILLLTQTFPLNPQDGTAHFMYDFAQGFNSSGDEVVIVLPFHENLDTESYSKLRFFMFKYIWPNHFHTLGFGRSLHDDRTLKWDIWLLSPLFFVAGMFTLFQVTRQEQPDVINAHWILPNGFIALVIALITKTPLVVTLPGSDVYISNKHYLFRLMANLVIKHTNKIVSNSSQLLKDLGVKGDVISYGVPVNSSQRHSNQTLVVATAGRRVAKKGFDLIAKIYPDIEIISGLSIDQFRKKLLSVDIFIALSIRDEQGNLDDASLVVLEAMAAGCAVIASDLPGYRRIIQDQVNGLLVNPKDKRQVRNAIASLKKSAKMRTRLGAKARLTIKERFTPAKVADEYLAIFKKVQ